MSSSDAHVIVRGQAQAVLIKVRLLRDYGERIASDPSFTRVFDGALHLADRRFAIGEVLGGSRFVTYIGGIATVASAGRIGRSEGVCACWGPAAESRDVPRLVDRVAPAPRRGSVRRRGAHCRHVRRRDQGSDNRLPRGR